MIIKSTILKQYQRLVDKASLSSAGLDLPFEGWMRTMRKALGMSGAQLARKMGVTRALISQAESNEVSGNVTMKTMQTMAQAMLFPVASCEMNQQQHRCRHLQSPYDHPDVCGRKTYCKRFEPGQK